MDAKTLLEAGHLGEAVTVVTEAVRSRPTDLQQRVFLFELLCFQGAFERAAKHLDAVHVQSAEAGSDIAAQIYRDLIAAEQARLRVFHEGELPKFLLAPPAYIDRYVLLVHQLSKAPAEAVALLGEAEDATPALSGRMGPRTFSSFRDADDRVAPVLELFLNGQYVWMPYEQIKRLAITPPRRLRELLWVHATIEAVEGSVGDVFLPALYPDTWRHANELVKLGRLTEWEMVEEQLVKGAGRHTCLVDGQEMSLLELGELEFGETPTP